MLKIKKKKYLLGVVGGMFETFTLGIVWTVFCCKKGEKYIKTYFKINLIQILFICLNNFKIQRNIK